MKPAPGREFNAAGTLEVGDLVFWHGWQPVDAIQRNLANGRLFLKLGLPETTLEVHPGAGMWRNTLVAVQP